MKKPYARPVIKKLQAGLLNKYGISAQGRRQARPALDGVPVEELARRYGSPLFVYSERTIRRRFRQFRDAFATRYPDVTFGWSYKTNYLQAICAVFHEEGAWAEIVSRMEFEKARALGVPGERIIFNGPHKPYETLRAAASAGAFINLDHADEADDLERVAEELGHTLQVGVRVNLDAGIYPQWSRFGLNLESGQAISLIRRLAHGGRLKVAGLHCHLGTYLLDPSAYRKQVAKLVEFAGELEDRFGYHIRYLDVGGGFPSQSKLRGSYLSSDVAVPSIDEYAEAICGSLHQNLRKGHRPKLILEAGRALIDEAGSLITTIVAAKRLADGVRAYVVDAGVNLLYTAPWYKFNIDTEQPCHGVTEPAVLYGPLCMNIDCLDEAIPLPPLERGQRLIVSPVGAYNNTQWLQFIEYRPNVVMISEEGEVELIREAEELSDIERRERLPERLKRRDDPRDDPRAAPARRDGERSDP